MVLCAVCSASRRPMSSLSAEQMKAFEALVSQFVNLEPLIKSHTILMCLPCMDQVEMVRKFQSAAAAGVQRLLSFLQGNDQSTSDPNKTVMVTIKQEPLDTCFDVKLEVEDETHTSEPPSQVSVSEVIVMKCEPDTDSTNELAENKTQETEMVTETAKENTAKSESTHVETVLNNKNKMATITQNLTKVLKKGKTEDAAASTSKFALRTQINSSASALLKSNIYDPEFLNKYFSKSCDDTQPETSLHKETNMATSSENSLTTPNGHIPNETNPTTNQDNSQKQKNYRTKQIVSCSICGATFLSKRFMAIHLRAKHTSKESRVDLCCDACGVTSRSPAAHRRHVASAHNAQVDAKFECDECTKTFPIEDRLKEHKERVHLNKTDSISRRVLLHTRGILAQRKGKRKKGNAGKKGETGKKETGHISYQFIC